MALAAALAAGLVPLGAGAADSEVRRALLIGINEYQAFPNLRGALNDLAMVESVLTTRFGFQRERIRRVTDAQATRAGILDALEVLVREAGPQDVVYVHYSGHGSQVEDLDGDEEDGLDETLVPHDGRTEGVPDITDDELGLVLGRLRSKRAVVVLDSCHSGTATRGGVVVQARFVPQDTRTELYARPDLGTRAVIPIVGNRYLLLSAAPSDQSALDGPVNGRYYGLFSFALATSLGSVGPDTASREVIAQVERELARVKGQLGLASIPEPQLEGPADRLGAPLFPSASAASPGEMSARLPFALVEPRPGAAAVVLRGAVPMGGAVGSLWAIYPPDERRFRPGAALAEAEVLEARRDDAVARLEPPAARIGPGSRAVLLAPPSPGSRVPVQWRSDGSVRAESTLAALRARVPELEIVGDGQFARFVVEADGAQFRVFGADGVSSLQAVSAPDANVAARDLAVVLGRSITADQLLAIDNPASAMRLGLAVARPGERGLTLVPASSASTFRVRRSGEPRSAETSLMVRAESSADCFLTLTHVDPEGGVQVLFPNPLSEARGFHADGRIGADEPVFVPDSLEDTNQAGFHLDYAPPAGTDTIRAFCSTDRKTAHALRAQFSGIETRGAAEGDRALRLREFGTRFARVASRGIALVPSANDNEAESPPAEPASAAAAAVADGADWTAASLTIEVVDPDRTSVP